MQYNAPTELKLRVFQACVFSTAIYNCETWGNAVLTKLEKKYCSILKSILGVSKKVCNEFVYIELGLPTLTSLVLRRQWIFYKNILVDRDWPMLRYIVNQSRVHNIMTLLNITKILFKVITIQTRSLRNRFKN